MSIRDAIATDLVVSPLGADAAEMLDVARCAEDCGFDGVWTLDHFSGTMLDRPWSRELFTLLGGFAVATSEIRIGSLVANMVNRHPSLLASAASTLQSMSGGRVVLGIGSGAAPGSRFASEQDAIGRDLGDSASRRRRLRETIEVVRLLWDGGTHHEGEFVVLEGLDGVIGPESIPPIIVGASGPLTIEVACAVADGVNIRVSEQTPDLIAHAASLAAGAPFEISIHDSLLLDSPTGGAVEPWVAAGVARRTLTVSPPFDLDAIAAIGANLNA
ncbi:MAG: LLM class flavin-dependent oxidoreductase [Actinomycetota bacterium]